MSVVSPRPIKMDLETLDPTKDKKSRAKFLGNFDWNDSTLSTDEKEKIEEL